MLSYVIQGLIVAAIIFPIVAVGWAIEHQAKIRRRREQYNLRRDGRKEVLAWREAAS